MTDELAERHWNALKKRAVLHLHAWKDEARHALAETLADVPERSFSADAQRALRAAEAKLEKVRAWHETNINRLPAGLQAILDEAQ